MIWAFLLIVFALLAYAAAWCLTIIVTGLWDLYEAANERNRRPDPDAGPVDPLDSGRGRGGWGRP